MQLLKKVQRKRWLLIIPLGLTMMTLYLFDVYEIMKPKVTQIPSTKNLTVNGFLIHTPGCRIPDLDPFDETVKKYYHKEPPFSCGEKRPLIESNQTSIWVVQEALADYNIANMSDFGCCYTPFWRTEVRNEEPDDYPDDQISYMDKCIDFVDSANIYHEYIRVVCKTNNTDVYKDFHAFVVPKVPGGRAKVKGNKQGISMLIIGMDAVSRLNFQRQMTKTREYLKSLKAIELVGYNKVHDNTFPNLVPLFSGYSIDDIQSMCWFDDSNFFDRCPWIWKKLNANGYLTSFGEDACWMGTFNYVKKGFVEPPTDYYLRPYIKANEDQIGHSQKGNAKFCCGSRFAAEVLMDYAFKAVTNLTQSDKKFWGFFWSSSLTHDFLNFPPNADDIYENLLRKLNESKVFEKTAVFVMSDHGIRWGPIRETLQGRLEERLPLQFIILPEWFKEKYPAAMRNLRRNTRLLTTHFDVHETMNDLMDLSRLEEEALVKRRMEWNRRAGISLFLPISMNRTCMNAGIPPEWCTCHESKDIDVLDANVVRAANVLVEHINSMVAQYVQCARLTLKTINFARLDSPTEKVKGDSQHQILDYVLLITTQPGDGKFEATVRHKPDSNTLTVQGFVSRVNMYGSQSRCILDFRLKLYCYCL